MSHELKTLNSVWNGIYESFGAAGGDQPAFESERWIRGQKEKILAKYQQLNNKSLTSSSITNDYPLALVVATLFASQAQVSVLDFGGGMGYEYLNILAKVPLAEQGLLYSIVEGAQTIAHLPAEIHTLDKLSFFTNLDDVTSHFDMVHVGSTLQYVDDWQGLLHRLIDIADATFFVFSDLLAGDIPTFITRQYYYGSHIPMRFLNHQDIIHCMQKLGFEALYKAKYNPRPALGYYPNEGLPETHRLTHHEHWIFIKTKPSLKNNL